MKSLPRLLSFVLLILLISLTACGPANRQEIDLSDQTIDKPADGIGHYVYALSMPQTIKPGETLEIQMDWRTVGPADGRKRYAMDVRLAGPQEIVFDVDPSVSTVGEINLVNWLNYYFKLPTDFTPGVYSVAVRLREGDSNDQIVQLGFDPSLAAGEGFYRVGELTVQ